MREAVERVIVERVVRAALGRGWFISVWDGGEWVIRAGCNEAAILKALGSTDSDTLAFRSGEFAEVRIGSVLCVWGNACDVLSDWTDCEPINSLVQPILDDVYNTPAGWTHAG